jgi:hypothetical protein
VIIMQHCSFGTLWNAIKVRSHGCNKHCWNSQCASF